VDDLNRNEWTISIGISGRIGSEQVAGMGRNTHGTGWTPRGESKAWYWYSPEVKNFVKCQYEKGYIEGLDEKGARQDWELVSYELKK